jgi:hypothetical protein
MVATAVILDLVSVDFLTRPTPGITAEYIAWFSMQLLPLAAAACLASIAIDLHTTLYIV